MKNIEVKTRAYIAEAVHDIVSDPDLDLDLTAEAHKRLLRARQGKERSFSLSEIKKMHRM